jgi:hypothetical protein
LIVCLISLDPWFDCAIYAEQVCIGCLPTYELHISLLVIGLEERRHSVILPYDKNTTYFERRQKAKHHCSLGEDPQIPQMKDLRGSYKGNSEFYFENLTKLQNNG